MKRILGIGAIALFFLILVALVVIKLIPSHSTSSTTTAQQAPDPFASAATQSSQIQTDTPADTVRSCYAWYVQATGYGANALTAQDQKEAGQCFTSDFISQWSSTVDSSGADPVLLSQFIGKTWNIISVSNVSQSINSSDELVTLGTGDEQAKLVAHVTKNTDGTWRVASVSTQ